MRQAMATLCRQLHDVESQDPIYRWSIAALHRTGFDALLVFYYTVTAINELREPLHDEVCSRVFRVVGERLEPWSLTSSRASWRASSIPSKGRNAGKTG